MCPYTCFDDIFHRRLTAPNALMAMVHMNVASAHAIQVATARTVNVMQPKSVLRSQMPSALGQYVKHRRILTGSILTDLIKGDDKVIITFHLKL